MMNDPALPFGGTTIHTFANEWFSDFNPRHPQEVTLGYLKTLAVECTHKLPDAARYLGIPDTNIQAKEVRIMELFFYTLKADWFTALRKGDGSSTRKLINDGVEIVKELSTISFGPAWQLKCTMFRDLVNAHACCLNRIPKTVSDYSHASALFLQAYPSITEPLEISMKNKESNLAELHLEALRFDWEAGFKKQDQCAGNKALKRAAEVSKKLSKAVLLHAYWLTQITVAYTKQGSLDEALTLLAHTFMSIDVKNSILEEMLKAAVEDKLPISSAFLIAGKISKGSVPYMRAHAHLTLHLLDQNNLALQESLDFSDTAIQKVLNESTPIQKELQFLFMEIHQKLIAKNSQRATHLAGKITRLLQPRNFNDQRES